MTFNRTGVAALFCLAAMPSACRSVPVEEVCGGLVCEGFESYAEGETPAGIWSADTKDGRIVVDAARAASGSRSAKLSVDGKGGALLSVSTAAPAGHMKVYLEAGPEGDVHWTMVELKGKRPSDEREAEVRFGGQHPVAGGSRLMVNYETPEGYSDPSAPLSDCWQHGLETDVMPVGRWVEVGWRAGHDGHTIEISLDGVPVPALTAAGHGEGCVHQPADYVWEMPVIDRVNLGWESYQPDGPRTLWIDDVVLTE